MAYSLVTFDGVALPLCMAEDPLTNGQVLPGIVPIAGGVFNRYGTRQVLPRNWIVPFRGRYEGSGSSSALRTALDALRAKLGVRGILVRKRDDDAVLQHIYARLIAVEGTWTLEDGQSALVSLQWETDFSSWRHATVTTATGSAGGNVSLVIDGTAPVDDATITLTATANLVNPTFTIPALGVGLKWFGTVANTKILVINCAAKTVTYDGGNAFSGFNLQAGHTVRDWMPLPVATHALAVGMDSGTGNVSVSFYKRFF